MKSKSKDNSKDNNNNNSNSNSNSNSNNNTNSNAVTNSAGVPLALTMARRHARHGQAQRPRARRTGFDFGARQNVKEKEKQKEKENENVGGSSSNATNTARDDINMDLLRRQARAEAVGRFGLPYVELSSMKYHSLDPSQNPTIFWYQVAAMKCDLDAYYDRCTSQFAVLNDIEADSEIQGILDQATRDGLRQAHTKLTEIKQTYDNLKELLYDLKSKLSEPFKLVQVSDELLQTIKKWENENEANEDEVEDTAELLNVNESNWDDNPLASKYPFQHSTTMQSMFLPQCLQIIFF